MDTAAKLPPLARQINDAGPERAVNRLEVELGSLQGMKIGVLGSTYRGGVKEMAFSGVFPLVEILERKGALPVVHDPMLSDAELESLGFIPFELGSTVNAIIVQADHPEYQNLGANDLGNPTVVLDGRRILDPSLFSGSTTLLTIGRG
mgnify:FL=1